MLDEDIERTKECMRSFILARKLRAPIPWESMDWVEKMWNFSDDAMRREYRMLYQQMEREMKDAQ